MTKLEADIPARRAFYADQLSIATIGKDSAGKVVNPRMLPSVIDLRLRHFQKAKDAAGCRATTEMWEKLKRTDAASLYIAAWMRAVTAAVIRADDNSVDSEKVAAVEADRAMVWLEKAVAAGFRNAALMKGDQDLDALRDRDDFKKILSGLEAAKDNK